jgi:predicted 2-oxoglutarate/Fe(II)-dependent dioxygenase YbiX
MSNLNSPETFDKIFYYKNVIENPVSLINLIEKTDERLSETTSIPKWNEWTASGDDPYFFGYQKRFNHGIEKELDPELIEIRDILTNAILGASNHYAEKNTMDIGSLSPISISKYSTGKFMGPHVDSYGDDNSPVISVVLYLNDDYVGGELNFKNQNVKIKPEAGSIVIFPSVEPYYHESLPVTNGIKYMSPGFWSKR